MESFQFHVQMEDVFWTLKNVDLCHPAMEEKLDVVMEAVEGILKQINVQLKSSLLSPMDFA